MARWLAATLTATVGSHVTFTFTAQDMKSASTTVRFTGAQQFDIRVADANHRLVSWWGAELAVEQVVTRRSLAPGESMTVATHG